MTRSDIQPAESAWDLQSRLLHGVSRTFALTIPQLPVELRNAVGNGYLLCRIADTIEDDPGIDCDQKFLFYQEFLDVLNKRADAHEFSQHLGASLSDAMLPAEHEMVSQTPAIVGLTHSLPEIQQEALIHCTQIMCRGMSEFQSSKSLDGLDSIEQMYWYCYVVAGVVGEMLTELFCDHMELSAKQKETMLDLGVCFGLGLQMTNILKDVWEDREDGSCWLPREIFGEHGNDLGQIIRLRQSDRLSDGIEELVAIAHDNLDAAVRYTCLIPKNQVGVRRFCLWAIGMALLTLQNIYRNPGYEHSADVKISRRRVKAVILSSNSVVYSNRLTRAWFDLASLGLPTAETQHACDPEQVRTLAANNSRQLDARHTGDVV